MHHDEADDRTVNPGLAPLLGVEESLVWGGTRDYSRVTGE